jgi:hypothetical protein
MISVGLGVSMGVVTIINVIFVFEVFKRHGYECTMFLCLLLYLVYFFLLSMIPVAARIPAIAEVLPEIKELPVAQKEPGLNHCRRLAICRYSPVFDNHQFQKGKYQKCVECAKKLKGFQYDGSIKECQSGVKSNDPKKCYKCMESEVDIDDIADCTLTNEECASVKLVLDMIDPPKTEIVTSDDFGRQRIRSRSTGTKYDRQEACRIGQGSLCWFRRAAPRKYFGWQGIGAHGSSRPVFEDLTQQGVLGKGYPTKAICEAEEGVSTCFEATGRGCKKDEEMLARCACEQYTDTPKFSNPCEFLERNCDMNSLAYTEAEMKMKQADIDVSDIISVEDIRGFIGKLDDVSKTIP